MRLKTSSFCLGVMIVSLPCLAVSPSEGLFDLTLKQLGNIKVTGAAVRNLNLAYTPYSDNPFSLSNLQLPAAIDVVDHKTIEARGLNNVVEVVESMVGVLSGESPSEPYSFSTRGFSRNSIGVLYDGVSMGMSTLNMRPQTSFNLDRVEVVKGSSVLSANDGSAGGTVNIITKKPEFSEQSINLHTRYGRFNTQSYNLGLNASDNPQQAYRLDVNRNSSDGWVDNTNSDSLNASLSYAYRPLADMQVLLYSSYAEDNLPAYWGTPLVPFSDASDPSDDVVNTGGDRVVDLATRYNNYNVGDNIIDSSSYWFRLDTHWQISEQTKLKATMYQFTADRVWQNAESYTYDSVSDRVQRDRFLIKHQRYLRGLNLSMVHTFNAWHTPQQLAVSIVSSTNDFTRDVGFDLNAADFYNIDDVDLSAPEPGQFGNVDVREDKQTVIKDAAVIQYRVNLSEQWALTSSMRFERIYYDRLYIGFDDSIRSRATLDKQFNQQAYFLGTTFEIIKDAFVYANVARQHDPLEDGLVYFYDIKHLTSSDIIQYELGFKSIYHLDTELSFALYHIDKKQDYQIGTGDPVNTGHLISHGIELAIKHDVSERFRFGGNYALVNAEYDGLYDSAEGVNVDGNQPVNVPDHMLSAWLSTNDIFGLPFEWGLGYNYVSKRFANASNSIELKSYELLNTFIAYEGQQYRAAMSVRNLTDEVYAPWSDVYYPNQVALGSPRMIEASLRLHF